MKVLVVDDESLVRRSLGRALLSRGHQVIEAADGNEGLRLWKESSPDLVFLDVLMPGLTGPQVLKEMGESKTGSVVLISAFTGEHNMETALQMGADLFLPKPFEDIFAVVQLAEGLVK